MPLSVIVTVQRERCELRRSLRSTPCLVSYDYVATLYSFVLFMVSRFGLWVITYRAVRFVLCSFSDFSDTATKIRALDISL